LLRTKKIHDVAHFREIKKFPIFSPDLVLELHGGPDDLQLFEHPLHGHFLDGLVHDVVDLVLEVVQVQRKLAEKK
jgi:hypothetical protein